MEIKVDDLARTITKAGRILIENGAETYRVEDTMYRLAKAYNAEIVDSYATPTMLIISFSLDGQLSHNIKRVHNNNVDMTKIEAVNNLSREISHKTMELDVLNAKLDAIDNQATTSLLKAIIGAVICSFGFAFFFGGGLIEACFSMLIACVVKFFTYYFDRYFPSPFFVHLFAAGLLSFLAVMGSRLISYNQDIVIIASLMLLVPGLAITNAIRDSVSGDLLSGLSKTTEAIFIAISLAIGSGIVLSILGGL